MSERIKKEIPMYFLIAIVIISLIGFNFMTSKIKVNADTISTSVEVGNAVPTVAIAAYPNDGSVGGSITLTENTTTQATVSATLTDTNGYADIKSAKAYVLRHTLDLGEDLASCALDNSDCYRTECNLDTGSGSGNNITCNASPSLWYLADPTDGTSSSSADDWMVMVIASDSVGADGLASNSGTAVDVNTLGALNVSSSVGFGTVGAGSNTGASPIQSGVTNTGNKHIDVLVKSASSTYSLWCDNCTEPDTIANANEKYSSASITYSDDFTVALTGSNKEYNICLPKATNNANPVNDTLFWGLAIDSGQGAGSYTGSNTITATGGDASGSAQEVRDRTGTECF